MSSVLGIVTLWRPAIRGRHYGTRHNGENYDIFIISGLGDENVALEGYEGLISYVSLDPFRAEAPVRGCTEGVYFKEGAVAGGKLWGPIYS